MEDFKPAIDEEGKEKFPIKSQKLNINDFNEALSYVTRTDIRYLSEGISPVINRIDLASNIRF